MGLNSTLTPFTDPRATMEFMSTEEQIKQLADLLMFKVCVVIVLL
jgi:hypothetical protein